jgi:hypothetical protein
MAGRKRGDLFGQRIEPALAENVRRVVTNLRGAPEFLTFRDFVERAFRREIQRLARRHGTEIMNEPKRRKEKAA